MNWNQECAVVVPCLNEARTIAALIEEIRRHLPNVLVVDDGSLDDTGPRAAAAGAEVLRNPTPQGKGAALTRAWSRARESGFRWALSMDGDGQHAPDDIPAFLSRAEATGAALVVGNRMGQTAKMPPVRRVVNWWMSRRLSRMAGQRLPDTQCGFRLMELDAWAGLQLRTTHFELESELLIAFARRGHRIEFIPVEVIYRDEESKIRPMRDTWRWLRWVLKRKG